METGPEFAVGNVYSLKVPVPGKNTKTLFALYSTPKTTVAPEIVVVASPVGRAFSVGIVHSLKVLDDGSN
jgi:hypothetical protein